MCRKIQIVVMAAMSAVACSDSATSSDAGVDAGPTQDATASLFCAGDCTDFVIKRLILPTTAQLQQQYSVDFNGDGAKDNALGEIIRTIDSVVPVGFQQSIDESVAEGGALLVARLKAADLVDAASATMQLWLAEGQDCCPGAASLDECRTQGETTCFSGSASFTPATDSPSDMIFSGGISASQLNVGPARLTLPLNLGGGTPAPLVLDNAQIHGTVSADGIASGVIAGTLSQQVVDDLVISTLADMLLQEVQSGGSGADLIVSLFDSDSDGQLTKSEIATSELMRSIFAPDVDADGDGVKELSLGIGFEAVSAQIVVP